ncbi:beta-1,4-galactosyltransferase 1-like [Cydia pomonella]|uniref:beta-1,4-galactosyltransferase 1-like n=1 Tax=Cydia pomonella TaxID=82600 RepID=UPI002ADE31C0|nr:beta-1,4-galactosyltransferase 1-like [Cydia pomonella]
MGTLNYSLGHLFPVRKVSPLLLKSHKRYTRLPNSLHDCIERPEPRTFYRPFIVLILLLPLVFYLYRINGLEFSRMSADGKVVLVLNNTHVVKQTKGRGDPSAKTMEVFDKDTSMNSFPALTNKTGDDLNDSSEVFEDATEDTGLYNSMTIGNKTDILPHGLPVCEIMSAYTKASNVSINFNVSQKAAFLQIPRVDMGGYYKPTQCQTRHRIAILVPYRHREENLAIFLINIHQFLMKQQIEYRIFIIEQSGKEKFNKGRLFNAGFDQVKDYWECFIFHDVDLLPLDHRILYTCPKYPRYMSTQVYKGGKIVKLTEFFGGVTAMKDDHFLAANGYSNKFWGWGGEDNDMFWRIRLAKLPMMKYNKTIARYIMLPHVPSEKNPKRYEILNKYSKSRAHQIEDGLSTLKYTVAFNKLYPLFTHIVVDVNPYKDPDEYNFILFKYPYSYPFLVGSSGIFCTDSVANQHTIRFMVSSAVFYGRLQLQRCCVRVVDRIKTCR